MWSPLRRGLFGRTPRRVGAMSLVRGGDVVGPRWDSRPPRGLRVCVHPKVNLECGGMNLSCPQFLVGLRVAFEPLRRAVRTRLELLRGTVLAAPNMF